MKKLKFKLNVFDLVIIAVIIAAGLLGYRLMNADRGGGTIFSGREITVRYTLELSNLPAGVGERIKAGDSVVEIVEKRAIGTVVSCEIKPYLMTSLNQLTGETILAEIPEREMAVITLELQMTETDSELSANGFVLRGGTSLSVNGPGWAGAGIVTGIERD